MEHLQFEMQLYLRLIDEALEEGDDEGALELQAALERTCAKIDAMA